MKRKLFIREKLDWKDTAQVPASAAEGYSPEKAAELTFKGIPYANIINEWWRRNGGEPIEGERNVKLHKLAANLRAICDNRVDLLLQIMPRYGLSANEMASIVHSACKEEPKGISKKLQSIVDDLLHQREDTSPDETKKPKTAAVQINPNNLPIGLKESLSGIPANMRMPVICSLMPLAATYADGVEVEYCDGKKHKLGLMSIIRGEQASGKSICRDVLDVWKRQFDEEDAIARQQEDEWKARKKCRKANEKLPEDPKVVVRIVPVTISCSTFLRRTKNSNGHTLFSFSEELDTFIKTNGAGAWSKKYDIYRVGFDAGEWGQDYNSDQAESGVVNVRYNFTMLGTNGTVRKLFPRENIENGLSSRILFSEMPDTSFAKLTKYKPFSAKEDEAIQEAVTRLRNAQGEINLPRLRNAIDGWLEEKRLEAMKDDDKAKDTYRRRAAVIAFRCGTIFHILSGTKKVSKACLDFTIMMADYCLEQQLKLFGKELRDQLANAQNEPGNYSSNKKIYDMLPEVFTKDDLRALKPDCTDGALRNIIMRWKQAGLIKQISPNQWMKTSD